MKENCVSLWIYKGAKFFVVCQEDSGKRIALNMLLVSDKKKEIRRKRIS